MVKAKKGPRITVSLSETDHEMLQALAAKYDVSLSWLTRRAVTEFVERHSDGQLKLPLVGNEKEERKLSHGQV